MTSRTALPPHPFHAPERALSAQTRLDEFEIETVLAQSSFGIVYRAYDHVLKRHVAIKEYLPDALALRSAETQVVLRARTHAERFEQGLQAFVAEAQTLARCEHPALQRVSRLLLRHGTAYRAMRYSPGPTLLQHRRELGATPDAASLRGWLDALLGALDALHEEGCVHGAVAPGNILLLPENRPLLLDFDAVRIALISDRTQSMMAALEPCYEPPEQRAPTADSVPGPWSDLYALAATLHFCISGQLPAPPGSDLGGRRFEPLAAVWQRLQLAQPALGDAPPWLAALDACLREDPQARPQSVQAMRLRLGAAAPADAAAAVVPPAKVAVPEVHRDAVPPARVAAPAADAMPPMMSLSAAPAAAAASAFDPPPPNPAPDPANAKVLADLDKTFAFIAAKATEEPGPETAKAAPADPSAPAAAEGAAAEQSAVPQPLTRKQLLTAGGVLVALLAVMVVVALRLLEESQPGLLGAAPSSAMQSAVAPARAAAPVEDATTKALAAAAAALEKAPPRAGPPKAAEPAAPAASPAASPAEPSAKKANGPASPREACGSRTRFSLYQCMQTQCAKRNWIGHAQCVQFRKDQKL